MKRLAVIGLLAASLASSASAQVVGPPEIGCNRTAGLTATVGTALVVSAAAGQSINICGWIASATAAATVQLVYGTAGLCATGQGNITAAHNVAAGNFIAYSSSRVFWSSPIANAVCVIVGGTGPTQITLSYSQF